MTEGRVTESNGCGLRRRIQYDRDADEPPSIAAATALARYHGHEVTAAGTQLYDYVDPDALDELFADTNRGDARATGIVEFEADGATVTIRPDCVEVRPTD
ncbi:hypothetical protein A6E15_14325 [Natrinema saccharevitans]|uniref:Halobacterial output domain-containing protein n=1 Tax=Natrinema saccharevitans TaxID=301967 RepID=A0A1S8B0C7_9EURY|nr:HalOD1 output domain-containing protein [Natrinema saccharevitans]OLZ42074.1 hypothetical protein A6E15_14325 [Natrinema saccharevitans]